MSCVYNIAGYAKGALCSDFVCVCWPCNYAASVHRLPIGSLRRARCLNIHICAVVRNQKLNHRNVRIILSSGCRISKGSDYKRATIDRLSDDMLGPCKGSRSVWSPIMCVSIIYNIWLRFIEAPRRHLVRIEKRRQLIRKKHAITILRTETCFNGKFLI